MNIQWYPGHMTKAKRQMQEDIRLVDLVIELLDARAPSASRNPDIDSLGHGKYRLILLNKADLADEKKTALWKDFFSGQGYGVIALDSRSRSEMKRIMDTILQVCAEKIERDRRRGIKNRPVRAMIVGIPNVGKSTFINSFAGKACAKTGNKPGVTKGKQWIRLNKNVELLDTPGILWPKFEDQQAAIHLACIGAISDDVLLTEELAVELLGLLEQMYPETVALRYGIQETLPMEQQLSRIARGRGCLKKGNEPDLAKAAALVLDEFRSGTLGRITLETP